MQEKLKPFEVTKELSDLIANAEDCLKYIQEDSIGYHYYWMLKALKKQQLLIEALEKIARFDSKKELDREEAYSGSKDDIANYESDYAYAFCARIAKSALDSAKEV